MFVTAEICLFLYSFYFLWFCLLIDLVCFAGSGVCTISMVPLANKEQGQIFKGQDVNKYVRRSLFLTMYNIKLTTN